MLKESYEVGRLAAFEKYAIGTRQVTRIMEALARQAKPVRRADFPFMEQFARRSEPISQASIAQRFSPFPSPIPSRILSSNTALPDNSDLASIYRSVANPPPRRRPIFIGGKPLPTPSPAQRARVVRQRTDDLVSAVTAKRMEQGQMPGLEKMLTSGRHSPQDIVDLTPIDKITAAGAKRQMGFAPKSIGWKGGIDEHLLPNDPGPRWVSGIPSVSAGYAQNTPELSHLNAYALEGMPSDAQGPWTKHISQDPRELTKTELQKRLTMKPLFSSPIGDSPHYEKVVDSHALEDPVAMYKPLPTPFRFQRTFGPNLLAGEGL